MPTTDSTDIYYLFSSFLVWFGFLRRRFFIHATARTCATSDGFMHKRAFGVRRGNKNRQSKAVLILLIWPKYSSDFCYSVAHVSRTHHTRSHAPSAIHRMKINRKNKKKKWEKCNSFECMQHYRTHSNHTLEGCDDDDLCRQRITFDSMT